MQKPKLTRINLDQLDLSERLAEEWKNLTIVTEAVPENLRLIDNEIKCCAICVSRRPAA